MKNITDYFSEGLKSADGSSSVVKEVKLEHTEIDEKVVVIAAGSEGLAKRMRNRVKKKISTKHHDEGTICDVVESATNLIDKEPTSCHKSKNRSILPVPESNTPSKNSRKTTLEINMLQRNMKKKNKTSESKVRRKKSLEKQSSLNNPTSNHHAKITIPNEENKCIKNSLSQECAENKNNLAQLATKKGNLKRKAIEEEKTSEFEKQLQKRKKYLTEPCKKLELTGNNVNSLKSNEMIPTKHSSNLLNYFSKLTPEQLERAKVLNAKVTVQAEVHIPLNSPLSCSMDKKMIKGPKKKKSKSHSKHSQQEFDDIQLIESETIVLSPKNQKVISPLESNKPKWSLKIQLVSHNNFAASDALDEDDIYVPTAVQKENIKQCSKIPKILLPLKDKKADPNNLPLENNKSKSQEKKSLNSSGNEKVKNEDNTNFNNSIFYQSNIECVLLNNSNNADCHKIENNILKEKSDEKIAPLFTKKLKPDPQAVAAKRLFLKSDVQKNHISNEKQKVTPVVPVMLPFPTRSHVNQFTDSNIYNHKYNFQLKTNEKLETNFNLFLMKTITRLDIVDDDLENLYETKKTDIQTVLSEIEINCPDVKKLWKSISSISLPSKADNILKRMQKTRKNKSERKCHKQMLEDYQNEILNSQWTDKYKPKTCAEIVGNEEAALKLRTWLNSWKSFKSIDNYSSSEEFYTSDCSTSSSIENNQVAVLVGPHGSGKTASVYAIAQELDYKVIEVNASSKRTGKKILKEFEEATKSHRVKKSTVKNVFAIVPEEDEETKKISQNSLILMEDVDLVFEEDEGFVSAVFQLSSNTKRPIVMTLKDTCSYLLKLAPQQLRINFQPVVDKKVSALMQLISLSEKRCKLSQNCIDALSASGDLRKGILQLQYFLLSNAEQFNYISMDLNNLTWQKMCTYIYKPLIKEEKKKKKVKDSDKNIKCYNIFSELSKNVDSFMLMSDLLHIQDPTSYLFNLKYEPTLSLIENSYEYSNIKNTSLEIGNWLSDTVKSLNSESSKKFINYKDKNDFQLKTKNEINKVTDSVLSQVASYTLDRRALDVDYLASIRTICRAEEVRSQLNSKRGNRFFHYLQNSRLSSRSIRSDNILSTACKILCEKS